MVKILIGNLHSRIIGRLPKKVEDDLYNILSYQPSNVRHIKSVKEGKWDGIYRLYNKNYGQTFYSGLLSIVAKILDQHNIEYIKSDDRVKPEQNLPDLKFNPPSWYDERPYQEISIQRGFKSTRGIFKVATGGGKTAIATKLISEIKTYPFMFYVTTKDLMEQAYDTMSTFLNVPIGRIGGGKCEIEKINVCTVQTAVNAVNCNQKSFKISDYKFDEDDVWDKKEILSGDRLNNIKKLINATKGLFLDECIEGDSIVYTEKGKVKIKDIEEKKCKFIMSHNGEEIVYEKINKFWDKGKRPILKFTFEDMKEIECTENHAILTNKGWKKAKNITKQDKVLSVNVDAEHGLMEKTENMFLDIKSKKEQKNNGSQFLNNIYQKLQNANVDVEDLLNHITKLWKNLSNIKEQKHIQNIFMDMISKNATMITTLNQLDKNNKQFLEPVLEILHYDFQIKDQKIIDCIALMDIVKKSGFVTKQDFCKDLELKQKLLKTKDMEKCLFIPEPDVCHSFQKWLKNYISITKNVQIKNFLTILDQLELLGGFVMMDLILQDTCQFIQKDFQKRKTYLYQNGFQRMDLNLVCKKQEENKNFISMFDSTKREAKVCQNILDLMSLCSCNINWKAIKSIQLEKNKKNVYDIEVNSTHCFFANNILVHNCHHASSRSAKDVISASPNAFWKYGGSATPYREDGAEIMLQALFGKKIVDISASYLIKNNFLLQPYIFFEPIDDECYLNNYQSIYSECITKNEKFNMHIADTSNFLVDNGLSTLVLVQRKDQGKFLKENIKNSVLVTSDLANSKREKAIQDLKEKKILCMIATSLADEGLDIPTLDAALLAGGGSSATRVHQRVGRTLRIEKNAKIKRNKSIVVYYSHNARYLDKHSRKAMKMLKCEPEFNIIKMKKDEDIKDNIAKVMQL